MQKQTRSILDELSNISFNKDKENGHDTYNTEKKMVIKCKGMWVKVDKKPLIDNQE